MISKFYFEPKPFYEYPSISRQTLNLPKEMQLADSLCKGATSWFSLKSHCILQNISGHSKGSVLGRFSILTDFCSLMYDLTFENLEKTTKSARLPSYIILEANEGFELYQPSRVVIMAVSFPLTEMPRTFRIRNHSDPSI